MENFSPISAVVRLFAIAEAMAENPDSGISDLAEQLRIPKATIHRFMQTMQTLGYARQVTGTERYRLTMKMFELGAKVSGHLDIVGTASEYMQELADFTHETVHLASLDDSSIVYLHKIPARHSLQLVSRIGRRVPVHCTAIGKAIAANMPLGKGDDVAGKEPYQCYTKNTITNRSDWIGVLAQVREQGYAADNEEHELGVRCFSAPIFDHQGYPIAGVSVSIPVLRLDEEHLPKVIDRLKQVAASISKELGYSPG